MINEKCEHTRKSIEGKQTYIYKLKDECVPLYKHLSEIYKEENEDDNVIDEEE